MEHIKYLSTTGSRVIMLQEDRIVMDMPEHKSIFDGSAPQDGPLAQARMRAHTRDTRMDIA